MSFDPEQPTERDKIRAVTGDTDEDNEYLSDDEIDAVLIQYGTTARAAAWCAQRIKAILVQDPSRINLSDGTAVDYRDRLAALDAVIASGAPGGITALTGAYGTPQIGIIMAGSGYIVR